MYVYLLVWGCGLVWRRVEELFEVVVCVCVCVGACVRALACARLCVSACVSVCAFTCSTRGLRITPRDIRLSTRPPCEAATAPNMGKPNAILRKKFMAACCPHVGRVCSECDCLAHAWAGKCLKCSGRVACHVASCLLWLIEQAVWGDGHTGLPGSLQGGRHAPCASLCLG